MTGSTRSGGCQCGAVRFQVTKTLQNGHVCHCRMCQKATGGLFAAHVSVERADLGWTRGDPAEFESSDGIYRGFCGSCGTYLYFRRRSGARQSLAIGAFDDPAAFPLVIELGCESRLPQVDQLGRVERITSEEDDAEGVAVIARTNRQHPDRDTEAWSG
ncbi:aldehyde-activating protein [Wenxinia marina]|uniref:CENP-V/GFA domain-containing protein n=2 Tax=Wenxinia TaxID=653686 RepID=A0A0D0QBD4_9RHOB|nr:GFA family protein [Wenxinia marina]KIQ68208.1 hypothetical protein Wenmar_03218 [Wenxinia marina DSM 24838]GGL76745.1 aldehyde-activating protein [Wenxinia marina]